MPCRSMENVQAKQAIETLTSRNGLRFTEWTQLRFILKQLDTNVFIQLQLPPLWAWPGMDTGRVCFCKEAMGWLDSMGLEK